MSGKLRIGIIGCGDFLRLRAADLLSSRQVEVKLLYSPVNSANAERYAEIFGAKAADSPEAIINDPEIDVVCVFVPPFVRKEYVLAAAKAGKQIVATKPLAADLSDAREMTEAVEQAGVRCGVIYRRTNNPVIEAYKEIFSGGEFGKLALYKQDWLHHYPTWNRWATDPQKNGGPFMDAMLHNLNAARYLMGRRVVERAFFSDDHTHSLACDDTQFLKVDFEQGASAHLFITWAAELAVYDSAKNDREHIDQCFMVTDQGWLFRNEIREGKAVITATRNGLEKDFPVIPFEETFFDRYAKEIKNRDMLPADLPDICEAYEDLRILLEN